MIPPRTPLRLLFAAGLCLLAGACAAPAARQAVPEIRPGVARGYLQTEQLPDSIALLPPPPAPGSAAFALDEQVNQARTLRGTPRWEQAIADANLQFPEAASIFACAIGTRIDEAGTPRLYGLLRRTRTDAAVVSDAAKHRYNRTRPFVANGESTCTPDKEAGLAENGSYPSGHTSIGWAWALILAELAPDRSDAILARGRSYGESRLVCNVHWHSDVLSGRFMGSAVVARLHADPQFRRDMDAAPRRTGRGARARRRGAGRLRCRRRGAGAAAAGHGLLITAVTRPVALSPPPVSPRPGRHGPVVFSVSPAWKPGWNRISTRMSATQRTCMARLRSAAEGPPGRCAEFRIGPPRFVLSAGTPPSRP